MRKIIVSVFIIALCPIAITALAQDTAADIALDEEVSASDLGVSDPGLLPDNPFYFAKEIGRGLQSFFTFDSVKKAELRLKFANEKLMETKKLAEKTENAQALETGLANYQREIEDVKQASEKIKDNATNNVKVGQFLDRFTQQQVLHQRVLEKLEAQVPETVIERIKTVREDHLEKFGEVMLKLEVKENIQERLENNLREAKGSEFKEFENLEMLKNLEEKVPEEIKEAIQNVQGNSLKRLKETLEELPAMDGEKLKNYLENSTGAKEKQMEILDSLKQELQEKPAIKEMILNAREGIMEKVRETVQEKNCRDIEKPESGFCPNGRIIVDKDETGCILGFKCVVPADSSGAAGSSVAPQQPSGSSEEKPSGTETCITLWDPVCGRNGKTYSNSCFAKMAGEEIVSRGACGMTNNQTAPGTTVPDSTQTTPNSSGAAGSTGSNDSQNLFQERLIKPVKQLLQPLNQTNTDSSK